MMIKTFLNRKLTTTEYLILIIKELVTILLIMLLYVYLPAFFSSIKSVDLSTFASVGVIILVFVIISKLGRTRKTKRTINSIVIDSEYIAISDTLDQVKVSIKEIQNLKVFYEGYNGYRVGRYVSNGDYNKISFNYFGNFYEYQFDLDSEEMMEELTSVLSYWYEAGYKFKEYKNGQRSYLFNNELNYQEIQELKRQFNFEWK